MTKMSGTSRKHEGDAKYAPRPSRLKQLRNLLLIPAAVGAGGMYAGIKTHEWGEELTRASVDRAYHEDAAIHEAVNVLQETYGVTIHFTPLNHSKYDTERLTSEEARAALLELTDAFASYPPDFFQRNKIDSVTLIKNYTKNVDGETLVLGGAAEGEARALIMDYTPGRHTMSFKEMFDHEVYHVLDFHDGRYENSDTYWKSLHKECACTPYGRPSYPRPTLTTRETIDPTTGRTVISYRVTRHFDPFVSQYGSSNPLEDRAEFARILLNPLEHVLLLESIERNQHELSKKILLEKYHLIRGDYERWSGGVMNAAYWEQVLAKGRDIRARSQVRSSSVASSGVPESDTYEIAYEYTAETYDDYHHVYSDLPIQTLPPADGMPILEK